MDYRCISRARRPHPLHHHSYIYCHEKVRINKKVMGFKVQLATFFAFYVCVLKTAR